MNVTVHGVAVAPAVEVAATVACVVGVEVVGAEVLVEVGAAAVDVAPVVLVAPTVTTGEAVAVKVAGGEVATGVEVLVAAGVTVVVAQGMVPYSSVRV